MANAKTLDFSNVQERANFRTARMPRGSHRAKVIQVDSVKSKSSNQPQWVFHIVPTSYRRRFPYYCQFGEDQLWKIRNLWVAAGVNIPKKKVKLDPNKIVGKEIGIEVDDDEYEGKEKSVIVDVFPVSELTDRDEPEDDEDEDEVEEEEETEDEDEDEDEDEAEEEIEEDEDEEPEPPKKSKKKGKGKKRKVEDEDLDELEVEEL